ncbi:optineurin-like isoform X2 [Actinia tenebrosa]|uniref:Optineurin-like isoform X2 n=1 Tax=Actinia tenebrosa TaxID=6105 RepID=A0A6P8IHS2_ACTTE|nr:optineurin-like isoform X2 [Actinia tenebrosa]
MSLTMNAMSTSPKSSLSDTDDFVMVSNSPPPSTSVEVLKESLEQKEYGEQPSSDLLPKAVSEKPKDNEILEKFVALAKENEELRETLKHNNNTLQKHINEFAEMQDQYKQNNETIKKEHQKAKEVVTKLRNENKSLKEQLKSLDIENGEILKKEKELGIEKENAFLRQQINTLKGQISQIDNQIEENQFTEVAVENWHQLLGSIASYEYQTGTLFHGIEKQHESSSEVSSEDISSQKDGYSQLEAVKVDLDKLKDEKDHMEKQLLEMLEINKKLQTRSEHAKEEKEELQKMLNERLEKDAERGNEQQELKEMVHNLNAKVESLNEELQKKTQEMSEAEKENKRLAAECEVRFQKEEELKQKLREMEIEMLKKADEDDSVSKEKFEMIKMQYIKYQGQVDKLENEKKELQDKLKPSEEQKNKLQEELDNVKKDKEMAEEKLLEFRKLMEEELESRSETYREKLIQLHSELEEGRNREEHNLKQLENLQSEVEEGKRREVMLQERLETFQTTLEEKESMVESLQDQVCHLIEENESFKVKNDKLTEINARRDKLYEGRMKNMEKEGYNREKEMLSLIDMLKTEIGSLKEENKKYLEQRQMSRKEMERLETQYESLLKEYDELFNLYNGTLEESRSKRSDASAEIDTYKRQIDFLSAERSCFEEALHKKDFQIQEMEEDLQELQSCKERVSVLEQQLEVYRNDFQAERESRERQHEEYERVRMENEDLQRELDNLANNQMAEMQRRHGSHVPHHSVIGLVNQQPFRNGFYRRGGEPDPRGGFESGGGRNAPGQGTPDEQSEDPYQCHGCRKNFVRFSELQTHVRECPAALHGNGPPQAGVGNSQPYCPKCGNEFPDLDTLQIHVLECLDTE